MAQLNRRALRATLLAVLGLLAAAGLLIFAAFSLMERLDAGLTARIQVLEDITDEDLTSGVNHYSARNWVGTQTNGHLSLHWGSMTGWRTLSTISLRTPEDVTLSYAVTDPGEGFRLVLALPDDTVLDLEEGETTLSLPAGKTRLVLASCQSGGAFTLAVTKGPSLDFDQD